MSKRLLNEQATEAIEIAVQRSDHVTVKELVPKWLKKQKYSTAARIQASEWFRRIAETLLAIKALGIEQEFLTWDKLTADQARLQLQFARLLNAWGASQTALTLLEAVPAKIISENSMAAAGILLSNYRYPEATQALRLAVKQNPKHPLIEILLARALQGLSLQGQDHWEESDERLSRIELNHRAASSSVSGIASQTLASNALLRGDLRRAQKDLERMRERRASLGTSVDQGNGWKWELAFHALKGEASRAKEALAQAWSYLHIPSEKPEIWTELYFWTGLLQFQEKPKVFPSDWAFLEAYPSPGSRAQDWARERWAKPLPTLLEFGDGSQIWDCDSWDWSRTEKLVGYLRIAGIGGIPQYRISETLWLDEPYSIFSWEKRLENLVFRARKEMGFALEWKERHLTSKSKSKDRLQLERVQVQAEERRKSSDRRNRNQKVPSIQPNSRGTERRKPATEIRLEEQWIWRSEKARALQAQMPNLTRAHLQEAYGVSPRTASRILAEWKEKQALRTKTEPKT